MFPGVDQSEAHFSGFFLSKLLGKMALVDDLRSLVGAALASLYPSSTPASSLCWSPYPWPLVLHLYVLCMLGPCVLTVACPCAVTRQDPEFYRNIMFLESYEGNVEDLGLTFTVPMCCVRCVCRLCVACVLCCAACLNVCVKFVPAVLLVVLRLWWSTMASGKRCPSLKTGTRLLSRTTSFASGCACFFE